MKAVNAAVAASLLGAVVAQDTTWSEWEITTTKEVDPVEPSTTWSDWEISTTKPVDPVKPSTTWSDWEISTTKPVDPVKPSSSTWSDWEISTSKKPVDPVKPSSTWSDWEISTTKPVDPSKPSTTTWADWEISTKPVDPEKPKTTTWSDWAITTKPVDPKKPETTWSDWEDPTTTVVATRTHTVTVTVYPSGGSTWSQWNGPSTTGKNDAVVTSTVTAAGWSSNGWFGPTWSTDGQCAMNTVTSYGEAQWSPVNGKPSATWSEWQSTSTKPVDPAKSSTWSDWAVTSTKPVDPAKSTTWADWSKTSTKPADPAKSSGWQDWSSNNGITTNGNKFGMTYSPFTSDGKCKDKDTVNWDIKSIADKGFTSVRVYSTDCNTLEYVGDACKQYSLKVILGVFIDEKGISGAQPQVDEICEWAQWELVELIVVGNEAVFNGRCTAEELGSFIASSKASFQKAGYNGLCSTTEELSVWQEHGSAWCEVVDVVAGNLYAFFNPDTPAEKAGEFIQSQIEVLEAICVGKDTYVMESGWPSAGSCNGQACPSPENQVTAIKGIQETCGAKVIFFSFEDEEWKQPGDYGVEQHWGCSHVF